MDKPKDVHEMTEDELLVERKRALARLHAKASAIKSGRAVRTPEESKKLMELMQELYGGKKR